MDNPTKNAALVDRLREATTVLHEEFHRPAVEATMLEGAAMIESQDRDIAMRPDSLRVLYEIREALGFNKFTSLDILADRCRELRHKAEG